MPARKKSVYSAQISEAQGLHTPRSMAAIVRKGFKRPSQELAELLRLTNLVPQEIELPERLNDESRDTLVDSISRLPDAVRLELLDCLNRPIPLIKDFIDWVGSGKASLQLDQEKVVALAEMNEIFSVVERYDAIRTSREGFKEILRHSPFHVVKTWVLLQIDIHHIIQTIPLSRFTRAIAGVDARYLRQCEVCKHFFFAGRLTQPGCTAQHSDIIRKRNKRARDKANRVLNETRKKKRAKTAR
jgi:hypothetical protein